jgi:hypothetical protein
MQRVWNLAKTPASLNISFLAPHTFLMIRYPPSCCAKNSAHPSCELSQVIIIGKYEVDPYGMVKHYSIILTVVQKSKKILLEYNSYCNVEK